MSRYDLEAMVEALGNVLLGLVSADLAMDLLRNEGLENEHLAAIGFDIVEE
ncbi:MAG: hypothetical protein LUD12_14000 [Lachnospiraceae bacterium]|nr:hypothetical protein [Lachnospiraceae bacterium]